MTIPDGPNESRRVLSYAREGGLSRGSKLAVTSFFCMGALMMGAMIIGALAALGVDPPPMPLLWLPQLVVPPAAMIIGVASLLRMRRERAGVRHRVYAWAGMGLAAAWSLLLLVHSLDPP